MMTKKFVQRALITLILSSAGPSCARAFELSPAQAAGRGILERNCARCHSIGESGASPLAKAPPLHDVYAKFSVEELKMRLSEGIVSHFSGMPQIDFTSEEVTEIVDYLTALPTATTR